MALLVLLGIALVAATVTAQERASLERCVDVQIGGERTLDCLNDQFRRTVEKVQPLPIFAPLDARAADIRLGTVNQAALQQQYGKNLGRSVLPYRPPVAMTPSRR